jgi:hypothetical protein
MEIVSEPVDLQDVVEAPYAEAHESARDPETAESAPEPAPEPVDAKRRAPRAKAAPKARVRKPTLERVVEADPEPTPEPVAAPVPKTRARKPPSASPSAPAPGIDDVLGMLAAALLDQRQTRTTQRREMYRSFLE